MKCLPSHSSSTLSAAVNETATLVKEESSDESTIVSSQPSTLTRNQRRFFFITNIIWNLLVINEFFNWLTGGPGLEILEQGSDSDDEDGSDAEHSITDEDEPTEEGQSVSEENVLDQVLEQVGTEEEEEELQRVYAVKPVQVIIRAALFSTTVYL